MPNTSIHKYSAEEVVDRMIPVAVLATCFGFIVGWAACGYVTRATPKYKELSAYERQVIAIEVLCGPAYHWKGTQVFCGQIVADSVKESTHE